jgi:probable phosphoglycerate mutase
MSPPTQLWLLRHGATAAPPGVCLGATDAPLADRAAVACAMRALAARLPLVDVVFSSDLARARDTALPLALALGVPHQQSRALRELDFGAWEKLSYRDIGERFPEASAAFFADWQEVAPPGGESYRALYERVRAFWHDLSAQSWQRVVVVAHGGSLRALATLALQQDPGALFAQPLAHLGLCELDVSGRRVVAWNAASP